MVNHFRLENFDKNNLGGTRKKRIGLIMKIAMLGHKRIPSREGGVEIVVEELSVRMATLGHDVTVYNRKGRHVSTGEQEQRELCEMKAPGTKTKQKNMYRGVRVLSVPTFEKKSLNAVVYSFFAAIRALFGRYNVIHFHAEGPCSMLPIPHFFGIRTVATIHGLDWQRAKWGGFATRFLLFGEKMAAKYADEVIVLSENVKQYFKETYNRDTMYIPNGINRPECRVADVITEKYGLMKDSYILFLARLVPEKGVHYLLDAYEQLDTDKKLVIAGGSSHSDEYMEEIKKRSVKNSNVIMTGFVQGRELEELYSNAYIYVLPSDIEGMPLSLLEAMSYGNCCLVSNIPENLNVIENGGEYIGEIFEKSSVEDLRDKLAQLLKESDTVREYQGKSADYICEKYQWDRVVEETLKLYGE